MPRIPSKWNMTIIGQVWPLSCSHLFLMAPKANHTYLASFFMFLGLQKTKCISHMQQIWPHLGLYTKNGIKNTIPHDIQKVVKSWLGHPCPLVPTLDSFGFSEFFLWIPYFEIQVNLGIDMWIWPLVPRIYGRPYRGHCGWSSKVHCFTFWL